MTSIMNLYSMIMMFKLYSHKVCVTSFYIPCYMVHDKADITTQDIMVHFRILSISNASVRYLGNCKYQNFTREKHPEHLNMFCSKIN